METTRTHKVGTITAGASLIAFAMAGFDLLFPIYHHKISWHSLV